MSNVITLIKVSALTHNKNTRERCEICSKLTIKTLEQRVFNVNVVPISRLLVLFLLSTWNR